MEKLSERMHKLNEELLELQHELKAAQKGKAYGDKKKRDPERCFVIFVCLAVKALFFAMPARPPCDTLARVLSGLECWWHHALALCANVSSHELTTNFNQSGRVTSSWCQTDSICGGKALSWLRPLCVFGLPTGVNVIGVLQGPSKHRC